MSRRVLRKEGEGVREVCIRKTGYHWDYGFLVNFGRLPLKPDIYLRVNLGVNLGW